MQCCSGWECQKDCRSDLRGAPGSRVALLALPCLQTPQSSRMECLRSFPSDRTTGQIITRYSAYSYKLPKRRDDTEVFFALSP